MKLYTAREAARELGIPKFNREQLDRYKIRYAVMPGETPDSREHIVLTLAEAQRFKVAHNAAKSRMPVRPPNSGPAYSNYELMVEITAVRADVSAAIDRIAALELAINSLLKAFDFPPKAGTQSAPQPEQH